VVDSVEIDPIMYRGSNMKSIVVSSFFSVFAIFLLPVWLEMALGDRFSSYIPVKRTTIASLVDRLRAVWKIGRRPIIVLPV